LNLEISRNLLLKQLLSATPLKLLNRIEFSFRGVALTNCVMDRRTDGQDKNNMSTHQSGGDIIILVATSSWDNGFPSDMNIKRQNFKIRYVPYAHFIWYPIENGNNVNNDIPH
jgi:hypothetical protein